MWLKYRVSETGEAQIVESKPGDWPLVVRRTRFVPAEAEPFPDWDYHTFGTDRNLLLLIGDTDHRDHASIELVIRDLKALAHVPFAAEPVRRKRGDHGPAAADRRIRAARVSDPGSAAGVYSFV